jgi:hypothetical protein
MTEASIEAFAGNRERKSGHTSNGVDAARSASRAGAQPTSRATRLPSVKTATLAGAICGDGDPGQIECICVGLVRDVSLRSFGILKLIGKPVAHLTAGPLRLVTALGAGP